MKIYKNIYERVVSLDNLFSAWDNFRSDKRGRIDVREFERHLEENIFELHRDLIAKEYHHGPYRGFWISDPKQRHIYKATVRDRVLHHAIFSVIGPIFEETFIPTSFSCRLGLGAHKGVAVLERMAREVARNGARDCFVLKCDIKKFFDSVNHNILLEILGRRVKDENATRLLESVIGSYAATPIRERERESKCRFGRRYPHWQPYIPAFRQYLYERV